MSDENIVILGGKGMLGSDVADKCKKNNINSTILDLPEFDITNDNNLIGAVKNASTSTICSD